MSAFVQGHQAGQAQQQHQQQLEENKLRMLVLKHHIDGLKIEDQLRTRELQKQNFDLLHGQPEADIPSDNVTTEQPNLPATNLAGMMTELIRGRQPQGMGAPAAAPVMGQEPASIGAPGAQASQPGTHPETTRVARPVTISGVPDLGVEGVNVRPQSAEDLVRMMIRTELAKPYTLAEGAKRYVGGREVARGASKKTVVPRGGNLVDEENPTESLASGQPYPDRPISINGRLVDPVTKKVVGSFPPQARPGDAGREADRVAAKAESHQRFTYGQEVANGWKKQNEAMRAWQKAHDSAVNGVDIATNEPVGEMPSYEPPSFEEWQASHPAPGAKDTKPAKPAADAKAAVPKDGTTGTIGGKPVVWKTIPGQGAGWVPVTPQP